MKLLIGGDFAPTKANFDLFEQGSPQALYGEELASYLARFDFRVFDFETVLEGAGTPITKHGPIITTPERCMPGIDAIHPNLFTLANNHSFNLGPEGIAHTKEVLAAHGIQSIGAGADIAEARKPYHLKADGLTIGFYTCAEHEFNAAGEHAAGVNPYDPLVTFDEVREAKQHCDQLIVLYHGGMIEYRYPLPEERRALRKLVDCGADLVIGQHTHCIGCSEVYKGKTIVYGQGDFLFARPTKNEYRFSGLLIEVEAAKDHLDITFNVRVKPEDTIRLATDQERTEILNAFEERSREIQDEERFRQIYDARLAERRRFYLDRLLGKYGRSLVYAGLNKVTGGWYSRHLYKKRYARLDWLNLDNWLSCETHHEILTDLVAREWKSRP